MIRNLNQDVGGFTTQLWGRNDFKIEDANQGKWVTSAQICFIRRLVQVRIETQSNFKNACCDVHVRRIEEVLNVESPIDGLIEDFRPFTTAVVLTH